MKSIKSIKSILVLTASIFILASCSKEISLDKYYVTHQEKQGFMVIDVPADILEVESKSLSKSEKKVYKSVKKLNFLGFKKNDTNVVTFEAERKNVKAILSQGKYQELIKFSNDGKSGVVLYTGEPNEIDEVILFGADVEQGFAVVRVLGDDMNPKSIYDLVRTMNPSAIEDGKLKDIASFFQ